MIKNIAHKVNFIDLEVNMAAATPERITAVVDLLWNGVYEAEFRGKERGRFAITRGQLKNALGVERLHASTIELLQDKAIQEGLVIIDLDDIFPCVETEVVRKYRRPPSELFGKLKQNYLAKHDIDTDEASEEDENDF